MRAWQRLQGLQGICSSHYMVTTRSCSSSAMWCRQGFRAIYWSVSRRAFATTAAPVKKRVPLPLRFSLEVPSPQSYPEGKILSHLKQWPHIANTNGDNAAVILATPDFARKIIDDGFMAELASVLAGPEHRGDFHMLGAAVDHVAAPVGSYQPFNGLSIMRGKLDNILPHLWEESPPRSKEDANNAPGLMFGMGKSLVTVPGANTAFQNQHDFTLIATHYDLSKQGGQASRRLEKKSQHIRVPLTRKVEAISDLGLWAPLLPVTRPREVIASFGNIIKGVKVDGKSTPASTELEEAVEKVFKNIPSLAESGPIGIWAIVVPKEAFEQSDSYPIFEAAKSSQELVDMSSHYIEHLYSRGARVYQILSGGGGWGAKKGLLSLDPQRTHFAPSEEESLARFLGSMEASDFAPSGSYIQFFTPMRASSTPTSDDSPAHGVLFGVHDQDFPTRESKKLRIHHGLFGALSNKGIFTREPSTEEAKLSVPNSRVYFLNTKDGTDSWSSNIMADSMFLSIPDFVGGVGLPGAEAGAEAAAGAGEGVVEGFLGGIDIL